MHQKKPDDNNNDDALFDKCTLQSIYRFVDKTGAIIDGDNIDTINFKLFHLLLDALYHRIDIFTVTSHNDTADNFSFAVEISQTAAWGRGEFYSCDITEFDRCTPFGRNNEFSDIIEIFYVAFCLNHPFKSIFYDNTTTGIIVVFL